MDGEIVAFRTMLKQRVHASSHLAFENWLARIEMVHESERQRLQEMQAALNALLAGPDQQLAYLRQRRIHWGQQGKKKGDFLSEKELRVLESDPIEQRLRVMRLRELLVQEVARRALEVVAKIERREEDALNARATSTESDRDAV